MTRLFYTVDTELSLGSFQRGVDLEENFSASVLGRCPDGDFGAVYQAAELARRGLIGVFFVDPMPALVYGPDIVRRMVDPIMTAGGEVQLHIHTEWLKFARGPTPVDGRTGYNIRHFDADDQRRLLEYAISQLVDAGAPMPNAFRAGNYGADDNTLAALAAVGIRYDSSFNPGYLGRACRVGLPAGQVEPVAHAGVVELPVGAIFDRPGTLRPAQLCALSGWEMSAALRHAVREGHAAFTIVSHSFELLSRDRQRANRRVVARFQRMSDQMADLARGGAPTVGYAGLDLTPASGTRQASRLSANLLRTAHRLGEQLIAAWRYERARG